MSSPSFRKNRPRRSGGSFWILPAALLAACVLAFVVYNSLFAPQPSLPTAPLPALNATAEQSVEPQEPAGPPVHRRVVTSGDTAGSLLQEWLPMAEVHEMVNACKGVYSLAELRAGRPFTVVEGESGGISRFEYEINDDQKLVVCKVEDGSAFTASLETIEYDIRLSLVEGSIEDSLFLTMAKLDETPVLAVNLAEIFAWEINFIRDIQPGDTFKVLVEKRYRNDEFSGYGKMLGAWFVNEGKQFEAYSFTDGFGNTAWYNASGESVKRAFLKAPLSFTRVSSGFNLRRKHPVFNEIRPHPAIDYAAPAGTPVKAIGSGTVTFRGWGKGAGNMITLKHHGGFESMYLHLNGFAKNLKQGGRVAQGDVIGYVGSTGVSTGPHLDFRMKQNGKFINPAAAVTPRAEPVTKKTLPQFLALRDMYQAYMNGKRDLSDYLTDKETPAQ